MQVFKQFGLCLLISIVALITSCGEQDLVPHGSESSFVQVVGRVPSFTKHNVTTRSAKNQAESNIKYMALLVFDNDGNLINKQHIESSVPLFVIDRGMLKQAAEANGSAIDEADLYLIANVTSAQIDNWFPNGSKVSNIANVQHEMQTPSVGIPANGFPMVGKNVGFNLTPGIGIPGGKIEIPLENLYAKIVFDIRLDMVQALKDPSFQLTSWEVHNLPKGYSLSGPGQDGQTAFWNNAFGTSVSSRQITGTNPVTGANRVGFSFYMPEHMVKPGADYDYPDGITDNDKQRFKPCLVEGINDYQGKPTFVIINGTLTDHQGHARNIKYKVYLGANHTSDFNVNRNYQYNNSIVIRGVSNNDKGSDGSISIDHRVNISDLNVSVFMERETMLDSHFEVRPIRVKMHNEGTVNVEILGNPSWIRLEKKNTSSSDHCDNGKRKYFTQSIMSLPTDPISITSNDDNCVWVYVDEYTDIISGDVTDEKIAEQKKKTRSAQIKVSFTPNGSSSPVMEEVYTFQQRALYPVKSLKRPGHVYYIEFYEEYLHNFDSDDNFGLTDYEGMPWGLDGRPLSHQYKAAYVTSSDNGVWEWILSLFGWNAEDFVNNIESTESSIYYDFYLTRDNPASPDATKRDFSGYTFTSEIVDYAGIDENKLSLVENPASAVEYCYNKNKRTEKGKVSDIKWYMPSIDEIEEITIAAYTSFDVFQDKYYWASQPAFVNNDLTVKGNGSWGSKIDAIGSYSSDDLLRARATKVSYLNGTYQNERSDTEGASGVNKGTINRSGNWWNYQYDIVYEYEAYEGANLNVTRHPGNKLRTEKCRVRAVYKP